MRRFLTVALLALPLLAAACAADNTRTWIDEEAARSALPGDATEPR